MHNQCPSQYAENHVISTLSEEESPVCPLVRSPQLKTILVLLLEPQRALRDRNLDVQFLLCFTYLGI